MEQPSDDTPSASLRSAAPSEREPGLAVPFIQPPGNRNVAGDFHRPYATQKLFTFHHLTDDTPSVTPIRACQLPQRGSREWAVPFIVPPGNRNVAGDFHRPYETQRWGHCTIIEVLANPQLCIHRFQPKKWAGGWPPPIGGVIALLRICTLRPRRFSGSTWG